MKLTTLDRLRLGFVPFLLSAVGLALALLIPSKARTYSVKALLYQMDALLTALSEYEALQNTEMIDKVQKLLLSEFTERLQKMLLIKLNHTKGILGPMDFGLFKDALEIKWGRQKLSYWQNFWFACKAFSFVLRSNLRAMGLIFLRQFNFKESI